MLILHHKWSIILKSCGSVLEPKQIGTHECMTPSGVEQMLIHEDTPEIKDMYFQTAQARAVFSLSQPSHSIYIIEYLKLKCSVESTFTRVRYFSWHTWTFEYSNFLLLYTFTSFQGEISFLLHSTLHLFDSFSYSLHFRLWFYIQNMCSSLKNICYKLHKKNLKVVVVV